MAVKHKKLKDWAAAGLISEAQADAIHAYEEYRKGGRFGRGMVGLSLFAILVGVLSIIASNWHAIPDLVKITAHMALNAGVGALAIWAHGKGKDLLREGSALVFMGLTFTLIILIGQIFQTGGEAADAVILWFLITLPFFFLLGRGYMTAVPWMMGFLLTIGYAVFEKTDPLPEAQKSLLAFGIAALLPLALMADGKIALFERLRPALADISLKTGLFLSALFASGAICLWPNMDDPYFNDDLFTRPQGLMVLGAGLAALVLHALRYGFYRYDPVMKAGALFAGAGLLAFTVPFLIPYHGQHLVAALVFIVYWIFVGWIAQGLHKMRLVSLAITVIAIRIFVIYVELFGSLMDTGFGLISGGVVMLALLYGARRLNKKITKGSPA